ncbi:rCG43915 [Rattus norvegicus]|uniref:RCG43915 n=1 Tax=Rattus norvegicus TaxID=10116 RepID=A6J7H4_RAT|nr:rCG43915 [Rattus norvegicus]
MFLIYSVTTPARKSFISQRSDQSLNLIFFPDLGYFSATEHGLIRSV